MLHEDQEEAKSLNSMKVVNCQVFFSNYLNLLPDCFFLYFNFGKFLRFQTLINRHEKALFIYLSLWDRIA